MHRLFIGDRRPSQGMCSHARELFGAMQIIDRLVPILAGRAVPEHPADESRYRFYGRLHRPICVWSLRGTPPNAAS